MDKIDIKKISVEYEEILQEFEKEAQLLQQRDSKNMMFRLHTHKKVPKDSNVIEPVQPQDKKSPRV